MVPFANTKAKCHCKPQVPLYDQRFFLIMVPYPAERLPTLHCGLVLSVGLFLFITQDPLIDCVNVGMGGCQRESL